MAAKFNSVLCNNKFTLSFYKLWNITFDSAGCSPITRQTFFGIFAQRIREFKCHFRDVFCPWYNTGCLFYGAPEHASYHRIFRYIHTYYGIKVLSPDAINLTSCA